MIKKFIRWLDRNRVLRTFVIKAKPEDTLVFHLPDATREQIQEFSDRLKSVNKHRNIFVVGGKIKIYVRQNRRNYGKHKKSRSKN